ncbi:MAG TPA: ATP-binding cassette domain-containing protein [Polyangia bacterium]|nr:ATP-binding cassette domain-containing protein [Polyangia bacterium]
MIRVEGLTKTYGRAGDAQPPALDNVSFEVGRAEIAGLLGPNGAGKSTMMRILTCFLAPTRGRATLAGRSISDDPRAVRRAVGYLPEAVPLPPEMRVGEYLGFRAALKGIPRAARRAEIDGAVERVALGDRRRQIIGTLSRGYRQRVGLADSLLGSPPILILDEPTAGLDPNQIRETRALIRELGRERTILLSTHVLSEIEAVATRILILRRGRLVAAAPVTELQARLADARRVIVEPRPEQAARATELFGRVAGVAGVAPGDAGGLIVTLAAAAAADDVREAIFRAAVAGGVTLRELRLETPSLEEIFGRATADEGAPAA